MNKADDETPIENEQYRTSAFERNTNSCII